MEVSPVLFLLTLAATLWALAAIARRVAPARAFALGAGIAGWMALTGVLAYSGVLASFERFPPPIMFVIVTALISATLLARRLPAEAPLYWLIGYQAFRIPVEMFLYNGYVDGFVPIQMTWSGRNWDVLTGLAAIPVAWAASRNALPSWVLTVWNIGGLALLVNIMSVAVLSLPTPLRQFSNEPANVFVTRLPYIWLPAVLVPAAWFGHFAVLWRSRKRL